MKSLLLCHPERSRGTEQKIACRASTTLSVTRDHPEMIVVSSVRTNCQFRQPLIFPSDKSFLLRPTPPLHDFLPCNRLVHIPKICDVHESHGSSAKCIGLGVYPCIVLANSPFYIVRNTGVVRAIRTSDNVYIVRTHPPMLGAQSKKASVQAFTRSSSVQFNGAALRSSSMTSSTNTVM